MRRSRKSEINFIDWGGKVVGAVGLLGMAAYIAGYFKFFFYYKALSCSWVLGLHSIQDVIINGVADVALCSVTALPLFFAYKNSLDIDNNGRRIVGFTLIGIVISVAAGVLLFGYKLDIYAADLMTYGAFYLMFGVSIANTARYSAEEGSYQYLLAIFVGFIFATCFSSFLVNQNKTFDLINDSGGFPYKVVSDNAATAVLVGTVNGMYLLRLCEDSDRYKLISPSENWVVSQRGSEHCSFAAATK